MIHFKFSEEDPRYLFLKYDNEEDLRILASDNSKKKTKFKSLKETLNLPDPICFLPQNRNRPPWTQDFLFEYHQPSGGHIFYCSKGLWHMVYKYFKENNVEFDGLDEKYFKRKLNHTFEEFQDIVNSWNLKFPLRPYQLEAAWKVLNWERSVSEISTRGGKTLIAYTIFRYAMTQLGVKKILMIVPSIDLVKQGYNDFSTYGDFFNGECVWGGGKLVESANLTIGTFQSLIKFLDRKSKKYNPHFFDNYDCIFVDETHRATANDIKTIITQPFMRDAKLAFGMTGTLPKEGTIDRIGVHALLGAKIQNISPSDLMEENYISKVEIRQKEISYSENHKQELEDLFIRCAEYALGEYKLDGKKKIKLEEPEFLIQYEKFLPMAYEMVKNQFGDEDTEEYINALRSCIGASVNTNMLVIEKMMVHFLKYRVDYINQLLNDCPNNTLVLTQHTEYAKYLLQEIKDKYPNRHVEMIIGEITPKKRTKILNLLNEHNDCILVASYSILSTGVTLGNLCYGIFAESYKSEILNIQSIGRGLGLSDMKDKYIVYDLIDTFETKRIYSQGLAKRKIYKKFKYPFTVEKISL